MSVRETKSKLISFEEAASVLRLHHTTIRQRKAGTENLTHVRGLGRRVHLISDEVEALAAKVINDSIQHDQERKTLLRLAS